MNEGGWTCPICGAHFKFRGSHMIQHHLTEYVAICSQCDERQSVKARYTDKADEQFSKLGWIDADAIMTTLCPACASADRN